MCNESLPRIAIIGVSEIGAAAAFALIWSSVANELLLIDIDTSVRDDRVRDLSDAACSLNSSTLVRAGTHCEAGQCEVVIITTGCQHVMQSTPWDSNLRRYNAQHWLLLALGQANLERANRNISTVRNIVNAMKPFSQDTILVVLSNPIDLVTSLVVELSGHPDSKVLGYGTFLDTMRLREFIIDCVGAPAYSLNTYVVGMHDNPEVVWDHAPTTGTPPIHRALNSDGKCSEMRRFNGKTEILTQARIPHIFSIGAMVSSICSSILLDKRDVFPVSYLHPEFGCCFSWPVKLGKSGIVEEIEVPLDDGKKEKLAQMAKTLKTMINHIPLQPPT